MKTTKLGKFVRFKGVSASLLNDEIGWVTASLDIFLWCAVPFVILFTTKSVTDPVLWITVSGALFYALVRFKLLPLSMTKLILAIGSLMLVASSLVQLKWHLGPGMGNALAFGGALLVFVAGGARWGLSAVILHLLAMSGISLVIEGDPSQLFAAVAIPLYTMILLSMVLFFGLISSLEKINTDLEATSDKLLYSNARKASLIQSISDEIRTPLEAIASLANANDPDSRRDLIRTSHHLARVIDDISNDAGTDEPFQVISSEFLLSQVLKDVEHNVAELFNADNQWLLIDSGVDESTAVYSDAYGLRTLLSNLIRHLAIELAAPKIVISVTENSATTRDLSTLNFSIKPQQRGSTDLMPTKASVIDNDPAREQLNAIELRVAQKWVETLGGRLQQRIPFNGVAEFEVQLPVQIAKPNASENTAAALSQVRELTAGQSVLLVEDNELIRASTGAALSGLFEANIHLAASAPEALNRFENSAYALVIANQTLSQLNIRDFIKTLRTIDPTVPLIILEDRASSWDRKSVLDAGADATLGKPIDFDTLTRMVLAIHKQKQNLT